MELTPKLPVELPTEHTSLTRALLSFAVIPTVPGAAHHVDHIVRGNHVGGARDQNPGAVSDAIRRHPDIAGCGERYPDDTRVIGQYEADEEGLYEFLWAPSHPPESPIIGRPPDPGAEGTRG